MFRICRKVVAPHLIARCRNQLSQNKSVFFASKKPVKELFMHPEKPVRAIISQGIYFTEHWPDARLEQGYRAIFLDVFREKFSEAFNWFHMLRHFIKRDCDRNIFETPVCYQQGAVFPKSLLYSLQHRCYSQPGEKRTKLTLILWSFDEAL